MGEGEGGTPEIIWGWGRGKGVRRRSTSYGWAEPLQKQRGTIAEAAGNHNTSTFLKRSVIDYLGMGEGEGGTPEVN